MHSSENIAVGNTMERFSMDRMMTQQKGNYRVNVII